MYRMDRAARLIKTLVCKRSADAPPFDPVRRRTRQPAYTARHPRGMIDFNERPFIVIWEVTQACDLACVHCRASAQSWRSPLELSIEAGKWLIDEAAALKIPVFVLTGGDPLKRPDTFDLVEYAAAQGVSVSLTPSTTPLLTNEAIARLKGSGLARLAISFDGPTAQVHDTFRRVPGSYD
jgi:MoaA/NifB/PqqE/SkfB family radical SAM enzyme